MNFFLSLCLTTLCIMKWYCLLVDVSDSSCWAIFFSISSSSLLAFHDIKKSFYILLLFHTFHTYIFIVYIVFCVNIYWDISFRSFIHNFPRAPHPQEEADKKRKKQISERAHNSRAFFFNEWLLTFYSCCFFRSHAFCSAVVCCCSHNVSE